ncbi:NAD-dependent epimerase/dehydratase family protein [Mangrovibacterium lignilyticum]|uniref:NAD-dependent epimerase/dehydratase family protein n=1 Tax=Mangrovibacterium lignilyticum TaxID=2668052 RepID=UPI0013D6B906|nr:NAD-dependent epimerase/dehydratase family protein [Mangrovibacterium lignilyticum]
MKKIDRSKPILVTGGTGYLASWIIKLLLEEGLTVHTTVRSIGDEQKYQHLQNIQHRAHGRLKFFEADLLIDGSFDDAVRDCELIIHTASPFQLTGIKNPDKELIQPALQGVRNLFFSAGETNTVKRIVLTSSIVAMVGDTIEIKDLPETRINEASWNTSSSPDHQPYPYSKTIAEQEAWRLTEKLNSFDLVVINPGLILGPSLSKRVDSTSISLMIQLCSGKFKQGVPKGAQAIVDVRDIAKAHIQAGFIQEASGRHLTAAHLKDFLDIAQVIRTGHPNYPLPTKFVPKWLFKLVAPLFGYSRKFVSRNVGYDFTFDNSYAKDDLKLEFLPFEQTINDHFNQLVNDKLIPDKT